MVRAEETAVDLTGPWYFAPDPGARGESLGWHAPPANWKGEKPLPASGGWEAVTVPHCWSVDPRYGDTGKAWYRRSFTLAKPAPNTRYRLEFDAVFNRARVWINGKFAGEHEGGYTPFALDASPHLVPERQNLIAVEVDNSWSMETIPGARPGNRPQDQLYPWWNYGGITRPARIIAHPAVHVVNQKVDAVPDLAAGTARVTVTAIVANSGAERATAHVTARVTDPTGQRIVDLAPVGIELAPGETRHARVETSLTADQVQLWRLDAPRLYTSAVEVTTGSDAARRTSSHLTRFGIRSIETRDGKLLLNGDPVRLAGANRVMDHPRYGATEPDELVRQDMSLLKDAHLELARMQHYPLSKGVLDWADENGMLLIAEAGNWGFPVAHMENRVIREKFQRQMREMVESGWNHPSIIGWSVGNEYESWTDAGLAWTKDMKAFVRSIDGSRPVVFVALGAACKRLLDDVNRTSHESFARDQSSFHYSDILCPNVYASPDEAARWLDMLHELWPDKPILIAEYGKRVDQVKDEAERVAHFEAMLGVVRPRSFVCGLSYWALNDYRSRYPGTNPNGYRPWGLVDVERTPRALYQAMKTALAPVVVKSVDETGVVVLAGRADFPSIRLRNARVRLTSLEGGATLAEREVELIEPGAEVRVDLGSNGAAKLPATFRVEVLNESGFVVGIGAR